MYQKIDVLPLSYELTYHRYLLNRGKAAGLFTELSISEYIALHIITGNSPVQAVDGHKTYLRELADRMQASIHKVSSMVSKLKSRGLVLWSHDGSGEEGTYVIVTPSGLRAMERQEQILKEFYAQVIDQYGAARLIALLQEMKELEQVMDCVYTKEGGGEENDSELD